MTNTQKAGLGFVIFLLVTYTMLIVGVNQEISSRLRCVENVSKVNANISEIQDFVGVP